MEPAPINPKIPELLDAEASLQPLFQIIPAWIIGYFILNNDVILFVIFYFFDDAFRISLAIFPLVLMVFGIGKKFLK